MLDWLERKLEAEMKRFKEIIIASGLALCAMAGPFMAQEVVFTGERAPLEIFSTFAPAAEEDAAGYEAAVSDLHILGLISAGEEAPVYAVVLADDAGVQATDGADGLVTVGADGLVTDDADGLVADGADGNDAETDGAGGITTWICGFVPSDTLEELVPLFDLGTLPTLGGWADLERGDAGDLIYHAQECLMGMGLLAGPPDGKLGPNTSGALSAFQESYGLPVTGKLDLFSYLYLGELAGGAAVLELQYPPVVSAEDKFEDIIDELQDPKDAALLEALIGPQWKFAYDVYEGEGLITEGTVIGDYVNNSRPIDMLTISASAGMRVKRNDMGRIELYPVIVTESSGNFRPYVQKIFLRAGNSVCEMTDTKSDGSVSGTQVTETAYTPIPETAPDVLEGNEDQALEIRVQGTGQDYDLTVHVNVQQMRGLLEALGTRP